MNKILSPAGARPWFPVAAAALAPFVIDYRRVPFAIDDFINLPQTAFIGLFIVLFLSSRCLSSLKERRLPLWSLKAPFALPLISLLLWCLLSLLWAHNRYEGTPILVHWAACGLLCFALAGSLRDDADAERWVKGLFWSGTAVALLGVLQYRQASWVQGVPQIVPPSSTFGHRNFAVQYVVLTLPLGAAWWAYGRSRAEKWSYALGAALGCVYVFYASTRAGWVALGLQAAAWLAFSCKELLGRGARPFRDRQRTAAGIAGLLLFLAMASWTRPDFQADFGTSYGRASSLWRAFTTEKVTAREWENEDHELPVKTVRMRIVFWRNTIEMIKDFPWLGTGLGNFGVHYPAYSRKGLEDQEFREGLQPNHAHNDYLQLLAETGPLGAALLVWLCAGILLTLGRLLAQRRHEEGRPVVIGIGISLLGGGAIAFISLPFHLALPPFLSAVYLGILGAFYRRLSKDGSSSLAAWRAYGLAALAVLSVPALCVWEYRRIMGDQHYSRARAAARSGDWASVIEEGLRARAFDPRRKEVLFPMGKAYVLAGKPEKAVEVLDEVIEAYPHYINAHLNLGLALSATGRERSALDSYRRALEIKPDYAKARNSMGLSYMRLGRPEKALENFRTAVELEPANAVYHLRLGSLLYGPLGRKREGAAHLRKAVELDPKLKPR